MLNLISFMAFWVSLTRPTYNSRNGLSLVAQQNGQLGQPTSHSVIFRFGISEKMTFLFRKHVIWISLSISSYRTWIRNASYVMPSVKRYSNVTYVSCVSWLMVSISNKFWRCTYLSNYLLNWIFNKILREKLVNKLSNAQYNQVSSLCEQ